MPLVALMKEGPRGFSVCARGSLQLQKIVPANKAIADGILFLNEIFLERLFRETIADFLLYCFTGNDISKKNELGILTRFRLQLGSENNLLLFLLFYDATTLKFGRAIFLLHQSSKPSV